MNDCSAPERGLRPDAVHMTATRNLLQKSRHTCQRLLILLCLNGIATAPAKAEEEISGPPTGIPEASIATSLPENGDPGGLRAALRVVGSLTVPITSVKS